MRTLVISDLHLGSPDGVDTLRRPAVLDRLIAALEGVDRLVMLGDTIEMRHGPTRDSLALARPVLERIGAAMEGREVVIVPGNHDHAIAASWLSDGAPLGLEERRSPAEASRWAQELAEMLAPARLEIAYPGLWIRDDVYAHHGHYLDAHTKIPIIERLMAGATAKVVGAIPEQDATPSQYEAVLSPTYAWIQAATQRVTKGRSPAGADRSGRIWDLLNPASGRRSLKGRAIAVVLPVVVAVLNRFGIGPVSAELNGTSMRRTSLTGMREALRRLDVRAPYVVFGHSHRMGPLDGDDLSEWGPLINTGSWVNNIDYGESRAPGGPYWPGGAVEIGDDGPPVLRTLLEDVDGATLTAPVGSAG